MQPKQRQPRTEITALRKALRENLIGLRSEKKLTIANLEERSGVSREFLKGLEKKDSRGDIRLATLARIAHGLGVTVSDLLEQDGE